MYKTSYTFLFVLSLTYLYQNCSGEFHAASSAHLSLHGNPFVEPRQCKLTPVNPQERMSAQLLSLIENSSEEGLPENTNLVVLANLHCIEKTNQEGKKDEQEKKTLIRSYIASNYPTLEKKGLQSFSLKTSSELSGEAIVSAFSQDECLEYLDLNGEYEVYSCAHCDTPPNDPRYSEQRYLSSINHAEAISLFFNSANGIPPSSGPLVRVAVVDSGVDYNHPEIFPLLARRASGQILGYNGADPNADFNDVGMHGTHVAGLVMAASHNGQGISGVMGKGIELLPVRVASPGSNILNPSLTLDGIVNGINWAVNQQADIINLSLGGSGAADRTLLKKAIEYAVSKGTMVVIAAGNDGKQLNDNFLVWPAVWAPEIEGAITVGSVDASSGLRSGFSNYSDYFVEIMAPGSDGSNGILSSVPTVLTSSGFARSMTLTNSQGGTSTSPIQGTSMATPVVSGAVALIYGTLRARGFQPTPALAERLLREGSLVDSRLNNFVNGQKRLDLKHLIEKIDSEMGISSVIGQPLSQIRGRVKIGIQPSHKKLYTGQSSDIFVELTEDSSLTVNYQWYHNNKKVEGATNSYLMLSNVTVDHSGVYRVEVASGLSKVVSDEVEVSVDGQLLNVPPKEKDPNDPCS